MLEKFCKINKIRYDRCVTGSANCIFDEIASLIDYSEAWSSIKLIICDTTATNTCRINGVVVKIQRKMEQ